MLLSKLIANDTDFVIINEIEFDSLGIIESNVDLRILSFIDDERYINKLIENKSITMVLTTSEVADKLPLYIGRCICKNPRLSFFEINNLLSTREEYKRPFFETDIGINCEISNLSFIENSNVKIGNNVKIEEFVSIKSGTVIGDNTIIRSGAVIGSSGFEFKKVGNEVLSVSHCGGVCIGSNVEIKCNTVIDRAIYPWDNTEIGDYSKLDNLIHVGHACKIHKRVMIPANSVIGGRVEIYDDAWIGIGSSIRNGIHIGKNSRCNMGSVVTKDVADNVAVSGNFAIEHSRFIKNLKKID